jgi:hypothetical protein
MKKIHTLLVLLAFTQQSWSQAENLGQSDWCTDSLIYISQKELPKWALDSALVWHGELDSLNFMFAEHKKTDSILLENCRGFRKQINQSIIQKWKLDEVWTSYFDGDEAYIRTIPAKCADSIQKILSARINEIDAAITTDSASLETLLAIGEYVHEKLGEEKYRIMTLRKKCWLLLTTCENDPQIGQKAIIYTRKKETVFAF